MSNTSYNDPSSEKKVWRYIQVAPCPHEAGRFYAVQELVGAWVWDDEEQGSVFEDAELPRSTRVTYMEMDKNGRAWNVHSEAYQQAHKSRVR